MSDSVTRWIRNWSARAFRAISRKASSPVRSSPPCPRTTANLHLEWLETREVPAVDLTSFDGRTQGSPNGYFHIQESSPSWGDQIHLNFDIANLGTTAGGSFNVAVYLTNTSTINTAGVLLARYTGLSVPGAHTFVDYNATLVLPASNPFGTSGAYTLGMIVDSDNTVPESNEANNSNQGGGKDVTLISILPSVAVVTDSQGSSTDHAMNFGSVVVDGTGNARAVYTATLSDSAARSLLKVPQNGIRLQNGTNFKILSILSNKLSQAADVTGGSSLLAANSAESWTIQLAFDPTTTGQATDTLIVQTDDPANPTISVALTGTGVPVPNLTLTDSAGDPKDQVLNFSDVVLNGAANGTVTLTNNGSGPLTINQNGIALPTGTPFSIISITSSTQGAIDLTTGPKTLAGGGAEMWTVNLRYNPTATGLVQIPLTILSNSPNGGTAAVSLLGAGKTAPHAVTSGAIAFGNVFADGPGLQTATRTITLSNSGQLPLAVNQNGLSLATGTHFRVTGVTSSTQGAVNLASGPATLTPNGTETWTVTVAFDPTTAGILADTLRIASNDPGSPTTVPVSGTGLDQPGLAVVSDTSPTGSTLSFPPTLNDGAGGRAATRTVQLSNIGTRALTIPQNGLTLLGGTQYQIVSVVSSTAGAINLAAGPASIQPGGAEIWTVTLRFDPTVNGTSTGTLRISSNDPVSPTRDVALTGVGVVPAVTAGSPSLPIHVSAGRPYHITWTGTYAPGTGTYSLYYDTDTNPASGLVPIATGLAQSTTAFDWQIPASLVGSTVRLHVTLSDGSVTAGSYAAGSLAVDAANTDRLLSAPVTDQSTYTLLIKVGGVTVNTVYALAMGDNALYPVVNGQTREYHVTRVPTLVDSDSTGYDEVGNVTSTTDSVGRGTSYQYDMLSRLTHVSYPDGSAVDYTYDAASNLTSMHDATGWQLYGYDALDRLTSVTYSPTNSVSDPAALTIRYGYDAANRLTSLTYPSGKVVQYGYDNAGKLTSVTEKNSGQPDLVTTYTYSPTTGLLTKTTRPNDTETVYGCDAVGRLNDILHRRTSTQAIVLRYQYTLDAAGRRTGVVVSTPTGTRAEAYVYDDMNRLTQVTYSDDNGTINPTDRVVAYTYDGNGNRLTQTTYANGVSAGATETLTYAYGFENRLLSVTNQNGVVQASYSYDWRGNQVQKVTPTTTILYGYDARNLLVSVDDGTNHIEYQYDGAGQRIGQTVNGVATRFVVDPSNAVYQTLEERSGSGAVAADYAYGLERVSGQLPGQSADTFYLTDALGSVGGLTSVTGASLGQYSYDAFGTTRTAPTGVTNSYQFTGESVDVTTGLVYLRARSYDPTTGRFAQKDPLGFPSGPNRYVYGSDNPVMLSDPSGLIQTLDQLGDGIVGKDEVNINNLDPRLAFDLSIVRDIYRDILNNPSYELLLNSGQDGAEHFKVGNPHLLGGAVDLSTRIQFGGRYITNGQIDDIISQIRNNFPDLRIGSSYPNSSIQPPSTDFLDTPSHIHLDTRNYSPLTPAETSFYTQYPSFDSFNSQVLSNPVAFLNYRYQQLLPGGVLIDKAATLIDSNINDIAGASFDPVTHQLVFLGSSNPGTLHNVDLGLFATAIQSVYGSAAPPFVTLDPPAKLVSPGFNLGDGDGVIANGKTASLIIHYTPYTTTDTDDMTLSFNLNGQQVSVRLNGWVMNGQGGLTLIGGNRYGEGLTLTNGTSNGQGQVTTTSGIAGVTFSMPAFGTDLLKPQFNAGSITLNAGGGSIDLGEIGGGGYTLVVDAQGQDSNWAFSITNTSGVPIIITDVQLKTDLQHRKFGGRVDNTRLGWIMEEADRVMKELGIGKDQLTGAAYSSTTPGMPVGYQNMLERYVANNQSGGFANRFWFTPNEETLKRYIDPVTGEATVMFSSSTVKLNTEALVLGQLEDTVARSFAAFFTSHYDQFAAMSFPVHDPNDPTGNTIINVKIFDELRDAMKAVALARFFHDNNIPLDTWWLNSWQAPTAYIPATIPTLSNSINNGAVTLSMWGGVQIKTPNTYLPDAVAASLSAAIKAQRPASSGDLGTQAWSVTGTSAGNLNAVAASLDPQKQDASVTLGAADLSFASPGGRTLTFDRYYDSGYLGNKNLGTGWQPTRYEIQFQLPSYVDDYRLMRDGSGGQVPVFGATSETYLHAGEVRVFDHATGQVLNFQSSLTTAYALDNQGNPVLATNGLTASDVPTFAPGVYRDGSTLSQDPNSHNYTLTAPDGSTVVFDLLGRLLKTTDTLGNAISYSYDSAGRLTQISDSAGQKLVVTYGNDGRVQYVAGPDATGTPQRRIAYSYDSNGRLTQVDTQALQTGGTYATARTTKYLYNADGQISGVIGPDGITSLTNASDLRGRSTARTDATGSTTNFAFTQDAATGSRTTQTIDAGAVGNDPTAQGVGALQYFAPGSTSTQQFDSTARPTQTVDALGHATQYDYSGTAQTPTSVTLPTPGRAAISIQRNAANLPTVISDPANVGGVPVQVAYNSANLPVDVTDTKGRVTHYTYTALNAVATVTTNFGTANAATTSYFYNAQKLLDHVTDPLGHTVAAYTYDPMGRVLTFRDGDGITTIYAYDTLGRLKRVYDPRLTGSTNYTEYTYNDNDQVTQVATPTGNMTYQYDAATHRLTAETDLAGNTTRYGYDAATGQLTSVTQVHAGGDAVTQYAYDRRGQLVLLTAPDGTRTAFRSDALGRATAVIEDNGVTPGATVTETPTSPSAMTVSVAVSEPVLVAALEYWPVGQPESTSVTTSQRLADATAFSFALSGVDPTKHYNYKLTLTDRVGRQQSLTGVLDSAPVATVSLNNHGPRTNDMLTATATKADAEGDPVSLTFVWTVNGVVKRTFTSSTATTDQFDLGAPGNGDRGNVIAVTVTPSDGILGGVPVGDSTSVLNSAPIAQNDAFAGTKNTPLSIAGPGVLSNDGDADHDPIVSLVATGPSHGTVSLNTDGSFLYTPATGFVGTDQFTYKVNDVAADSDIATVTVTVPAAPATHIAVSISATATAGNNLTVTLTALDQYNDPTTNYSGTVHFTSSDAQAILPATATLTNGTGTFSVTLKTAGNRTITATDTVTGSITGSASVSVAANSATRFAVSAPTSATAGTGFSLSLTALDAYGNVATGYTGTVRFTSSDAQAVLPANATLTNGIGTFNVVLKTAGSQTVTVADTSSGSTTGSASASVGAGSATRFVTSAPSLVTAGAPNTATVTALDAYGNVATNYTGTVHFTSSDSQALLPADGTLTNGTGTFAFTLKTAGSQTVTASDAVASITGPASVSVAAGSASRFAVSASASASAGVGFIFSLTALDAYGNTATGYSGTVHFTSSDAQAVLPANATLANGTGTFSATFLTPGSQTITATDTATGSVTGSSAAILVTSPVTQLVISVPPSATAGTVLSMTVTALDDSGNTATGYSGTVHFASSDGQAVLPADVTLTNGTGTFSVTLKTAGNRTITATDTATGSITGSASVSVAAGPATRFAVSAPTSASAGTGLSLSLTALDAYGNMATGYTGMVHFTSSDTQAVLPADATLTNGAGTFSIILKAAGSQTVTINDTTTSSITGSAVVSVAAGSATRFAASSPASATAGTSFSLTLTALDTYGNVATGYSGTVHFTSSDAQAILPANNTLTNGTRTFSVALKTAGSQVITAADTSASIIGSANVSVAAGSVARFTVSASASTSAGTGLSLLLTALDAYGNVATGYTGTVHFTSSDSQAVLPANTTLANGTGTFSAVLKTAGSQTISARDTASSSINGTATVAVAAGAATRLAVSAPASAIAGAGFSLSLTALDAYGNTAINYAGTVHFTSSDALAVLPANTTLTNGTGTFTATLNTTGSQTVTVTDTTSSSITGAMAVSVSPVGANHFVLSVPTSTTAGTPLNVSVSIVDQSGNVVPGYSGVVHFTSSDGQAILPADVSLTNGTGTFNVILKTAGSQTITATDVATGAVTGTATLSVVAAPASRLSLNAPTTATAGTPVSVTATALDPYGNAATSYSGMVQLSSTDARATQPLLLTLANGTATFTATLKTAGVQTVTATDVTNVTLVGTTGAVQVAAATATHYAVAAPPTTTAGTGFSLSLTALDAYGNMATGYTGTVHFTSSDSQAVLPADATLANGTGTFSVVLKTAGNRNITATDTAGSLSVSVPVSVAVAPASRLSVTAPSSTQAGQSRSVTVTALDPYGNTATNYMGTVYLTSSDGQAVLPVNAPLVNGSWTFSVVLKTAGIQTITAADVAAGSITGSASVSVAAGSATRFAVSAPASASAGTGFSLTVSALDAYGNAATGYNGTIHFTSSDAQAVLPANTTLTNGAGTFTATLKTSGSRTVTATATSSSITGTATVSVAAGPVTRFITSASTTATAGTGFFVTVTAADVYGNAVPGYSGVVHFTSSDGQAILPADVTLTNGIGTFSVVLKTAGSQTITATDTVTGSVSGAATISVAAGSATRLSLNAPATTTAGAPMNVTLTAFDAYGNVATGYSGMVLLSSTDTRATLPLLLTLANGTATFTATLKTAGAQTVTATDLANASLQGTGAVQVAAATATRFTVVAPFLATVGVPITVTVTALDAYGNVVTGYAGTVHFTSTDAQAILPPDMTLVNGSAQVTVTLRTRGNRTIRATDQNTSSITGSSASISVI